MRVAFSKPVHAAKVKISQPSANHGPFTAKPNSCHVQNPVGDPTYLVFPKPVHVARARIGLPSANYDPFTAKPSSLHMQHPAGDNNHLPLS